MAEQHDQLTRVESGLHNLDRRLNQEQMAADKRLECIGEAVDHSKSAVFSPRPLSNQIATPGTLQDEFKMYLVLLQVQNCISARPASSLDSDIRFEDALGRTRNLSYEHF
ncbi:MAG: hypothetical protein LQ344_007923 [Seirophora lacunosa]|nr:MAG: hypothetical protein LQ344_007923 [Seirophora lacunosa]